MKFPFDALQLAIFSRLDEDDDITQPVFDWPVDPETQSCPYIVIGEYFTEDESTSTIGGQRITSEIHIYSQSQGMRECNDIADEGVQSLTAAPLDLSADNFEYLQISAAADVRREYDGTDPYRHATVRMTDIIYEKES